MLLSLRTVLLDIFVNVVHKLNMVRDLIQSEPSRAERRRAATSERILDAAMGLSLTEGLDALTMQRLARAVDCAVGAVYRYFDSKDAVIAGLQQRALKTLAETLSAVGAACRDLPGGSLTALVAAGELYARLPTVAPARYRLLTLTVADPRTLVTGPRALEVFALSHALITELARLLERAALEGALSPGPADERAVVFWSALQGLTQLDKLDRRMRTLPTTAPLPLAPARLVSSLVRTLLAGSGASPEALRIAEAAAGPVVARLLPTISDDPPPAQEERS
jgi:AcrR family transcriptional regulator